MTSTSTVNTTTVRLSDDSKLQHETIPERCTEEQSITDSVSAPLEFHCRISVTIPSHAARSPQSHLRSPSQQAVQREREEEKEPEGEEQQRKQTPTNARATVHASAAQLLNENVRLRAKVESSARTIGEHQGHRACALED
jgi:hypothetical protein